MKIVFILYLAMAALGTTSKAFAQTPLQDRLSEGIRRICESSPEKRVGTAALEESRLRTSVAERFWLPQLQTKTRLGWTDNSTLSGRDTELNSFTISAQFPFREMLNNFREIDARRIGERVQHLELEKSLSERLRFFYENLVRMQNSRRRIDVLEKSLAQYDSQIRTEKDRVRSGLVSEADFLRIQSERDRVERSFLGERSQLLSYEQTLANEFQWEGVVPDDIPMPVQNPRLNIEAVLEVMVAREQEKRLSLDLRIQESAMTPNLRLFGEGVYGSQGWLKSRFPAEQWSAAAGLELNWTLWDSGLERAERAGRLTALERGRLTRQRAEERFQSRIRVSESQRSLYIRSRELIGRSVSAQEKAFRNVTTEYRAGRLPYLDWITTRNSLDAIRLDQIENESSLKMLDLEDAALMGSLSQSLCGRTR